MVRADEANMGSGVVVSDDGTCVASPRASACAAGCVALVDERGFEVWEDDECHRMVINVVQLGFSVGIGFLRPQQVITPHTYECRANSRRPHSFEI